MVAVATTSAAIAGASAPDSPALYFLNIGQGDSELIVLPGGQKILIDGGPDGKKLLENLAEILPPQDRYIDILLMTHPQLDHFAGFIEVLKKYEVGMFIGSQRKGEIAAYGELHRELEKQAVPYLQLLAGDALRISDTTLHLLGPRPADALSGELNDTCEVVLLESPHLTALYTGDIDAKIEDRIAGEIDQPIDVLKVAHHGSRFSSSETFLKILKPSVAVIEVGKNTYGHPTKQALARLTQYAARVLRTDQQGVIKIIGTSSGELQISSTGNK